MLAQQADAGTLRLEFDGLQSATGSFDACQAHPGTDDWCRPAVRIVRHNPVLLPQFWTRVRRMIEFYPQLRLVHIAAVIASGSLFFVRGLANALGERWTGAAPLRWLSYAVDTVLLTAALMLVAVLRQYPFVQAWLTVKVLLLVVYIVLGYWSFWKARTSAERLASWIAALAVYLYIVSVALAHHPLGIVRLLST